MKTISRRNWVKGMALATLGSVVFTDLKAADAPIIQWSADQDALLNNLYYNIYVKRKSGFTDHLFLHVDSCYICCMSSN